MGILKNRDHSKHCHKNPQLQSWKHETCETNSEKHKIDIRNAKDVRG